MALFAAIGGDFTSAVMQQLQIEINERVQVLAAEMTLKMKSIVEENAKIIINKTLKQVCHDHDLPYKEVKARYCDPSSFDFYPDTVEKPVPVEKPVMTFTLAKNPEIVQKPLSKMKKADLVSECDLRGLDSEGTIPQLKERIKEARELEAPVGGAAKPKKPRADPVSKPKKSKKKKDLEEEKEVVTKKKVAAVPKKKEDEVPVKKPVQILVEEDHDVRDECRKCPDNEDEDDNEDFEDDDDEEVCPPGCDQALYEKVCDLREKRLDQEDVIAEFTKSIEALKKEKDMLTKKQKTIELSLKKIDGEIVAYLHNLFDGRYTHLIYE